MNITNEMQLGLDRYECGLNRLSRFEAHILVAKGSSDLSTMSDRDF